MMDPQPGSAPTMAMAIHMNSRQNHNPMDLTSLLNPSQTPPLSDSEEQWPESEEQTRYSFSRDSSCCSAPQPMEVDGEVPMTSTIWDHHESGLPMLPPMQLASELPPFVNLTHRPAQGPQMTQITPEICENDLVRRCLRPTSHSPRRRLHDHRDRRSSYPHLGTFQRRPWTSPSPSLESESSVEADDCERKKMKQKRRKLTGPHSNKPYTQEQVHWLRYHCEDLGLNYAQMYMLWTTHFPNDYRVPGQAFSSRFYRDNVSAMVDDNDNLIRNSDGKPKIIVINIRRRKEPQFKDFPFKLWEKNPEWALYWDWVMPEHKAMAQKILDGRDLDASQQRKEKSRQAIRKYEAQAPVRKGWYATPAHHAAAVSKGNAKGEMKSVSLSPLPAWTSLTIKLESAQISDWAQEYDLDSNDRNP
ncbi:hypothetical protein BKA65DRAFT_259573 [Rhexocercosporidium sp. MPI-PUGE-AT-0058]|nr:hypothetical protein BKA65DRAFT_259573 [Rhexocercosporidium sp. MPI-PUGE-AT-0058]